MEQRHKLWWNGKYGHTARRDVLIWFDADTDAWTVEARQGGAEGRSRHWAVPGEPEALAAAAELMNDEYERWRELDVR